MKPGATFCTGCGKQAAKKPLASEASRVCTGCGSELKPGASFCKSCGKRQTVCTGCGSELQPGASFCKKCGKRQTGPDGAVTGGAAMAGGAVAGGAVAAMTAQHGGADATLSIAETQGGAAVDEVSQAVAELPAPDTSALTVPPAAKELATNVFSGSFLPEMGEDGAPPTSFSTYQLKILFCQPSMNKVLLSQSYFLLLHPTSSPFPTL